MLLARLWRRDVSPRTSPNRSGRYSRLFVDRLESRALLSASGWSCHTDTAEVAPVATTSMESSVAGAAEDAGAKSAPKAGPGVTVRTETVSLAADPINSQQGFIDVFLDVPVNANHRISGYEVVISFVGEPVGIQFTGAEIASASHPPLFPAQNPTVISTGSRLSVTDFLFDGDVLATDNVGLFRAAFTANAAVTGTFPLAFETTFTNLADRNAQAVPIEEFAAGTITVGSGQPTVSITDAAISEGDAGTTQMSYTVHLSSTAPGPITVNYAVTGGTATAGDDYLATAGQVSFSAGETSKTINVTVIGDTVDEANETVNISLSNATGAAISDGNAVGTILDDDDGAPLRPWHHAGNPEDVDNNGRVTAIDALLIINWINDLGPGELSENPIPPDAPPPFVDVNADGRIGAIDALLVINFINDALAAKTSESAQIASALESPLIPPPAEEIAWSVAAALSSRQDDAEPFSRQ